MSAEKSGAGPREQTAAAIREHQLHWNEYDCVCGWVADNRKNHAAVDHAEHVADAVVEALGLTEEHGYTLEGEHPEEPDAWFPASSYNTSRPVTHTRWVSGWSVVGGEQ